MSKSKAPIAKFVWQQAKVQIIIVLLLVIAGALVLFVWRPTASQFWKNTYADLLSPMIAFGTLFVAGFVWYNEQKENWQAQLEKRLHIIYLLEQKGKWVKHCTVLNAPLSHEGDIRNWGQSIGQTIFPQELAQGEKPDPTWARIQFSGFKIVNIPRGRNQQCNYFGLLVFLKAPIKGADLGAAYIFDNSGSKWVKQHGQQSYEGLDVLEAAIPIS